MLCGEIVESPSPRYVSQHLNDCRKQACKGRSGRSRPAIASTRSAGGNGGLMRTFIDAIARAFHQEMLLTDKENPHGQEDSDDLNRSSRRYAPHCRQSREQKRRVCCGAGGCGSAEYACLRRRLCEVERYNKRWPTRPRCGIPTELRRSKRETPS